MQCKNKLFKLKKVNIMDFASMGNIDAQAEIEKLGEHISDDTKNVTIRVSETYTQLLGIFAERIGLSRQAFMSSIVEELASKAVAEYLIGYTGTFSPYGMDRIKAKEFFARTTPPDYLKDDFERFIQEVQDYITDFDLFLEATKKLPNDNPAKIEYRKKMRRMTLERFPDAVFSDEIEEGVNE